MATQHIRRPNPWHRALRRSYRELGRFLFLSLKTVYLTLLVAASGALAIWLGWTQASNVTKVFTEVSLAQTIQNNIPPIQLEISGGSQEVRFSEEDRELIRALIVSPGGVAP